LLIITSPPEEEEMSPLLEALNEAWSSSDPLSTTIVCFHASEEALPHVLAPRLTAEANPTQVEASK
jgi:hypothetical protein